MPRFVDHHQELDVLMNVFALCALLLSAAAPADTATPMRFDPATDVIALHYDHAPDLDDGQSAAADRTVLQSTYGPKWLTSHLVIVSGTYGRNAPTFVERSARVMRAVWGRDWLDAHRRWTQTVDAAAARWARAIQRGGRVWVKEGGQSDFTADVVARLHARYPTIDPRRSVVVVQHSDWNEEQSTPAKLAFAKANTFYVRIADANAYFAAPGSDAVVKPFVNAALANRAYRRYWSAAFDYYPPLGPKTGRLDFSDTGELTYILGIGAIGLEGFEQRFLARK